MGGQLSRESKRRKLEKDVLSYLESNDEEDYKKNPTKGFLPAVQSLGFVNIEAFIKNIRLTETIILNQNYPEAKPGIRYVLKSDPTKRGTLVKSVNTNCPEVATLKMDGKGGRVRLKCTSRQKRKQFLFDELEPEKVFLQSFLMDPFSQANASIKLAEKEKSAEKGSRTVVTTQSPKPKSKLTKIQKYSEIGSTEQLPASNVTPSEQNFRTSLIEMAISQQQSHSSKSFDIELPLPNLEVSVEVIAENYDFQSASFADGSQMDSSPTSSPTEFQTEPVVITCSADNQHDSNFQKVHAEDVISQQTDNFETDSKPHETLQSTSTRSKLIQQLSKDSMENTSNQITQSHNEKQVEAVTKANKGIKRPSSPESNHENIPSKKLYSSTQLHDTNLHDESVPNPFVGTSKGISGYSNSCYMDSMLVSMFYCTAAFNGLLQPKATDSKYASLARKHLRENIVKPLRKKYYCTSESAMKLRQHLSQLDGDVLGCFMDVEQLLYLLFDDALKEREFIQYTDGGGDFMHQTSIDNNDKSESITVQNNLETSMQINGNLKFQSIPNPALIVGLPRSNGRFVQYSNVIPNTELDISGLIEPAKCDSCNETAHWEKLNRKNVEPPIPFCDSCSEVIISKNLDNNCVIASRMKMRLSAIICVRASHFTAFVRNEMGDNEWLFFDSMSGNGPEVKIVKNLDEWLNSLTDQPVKNQNAFLHKKGHKNSFLKQRTCCDGHMVIYNQISYPG